MNDDDSPVVPGAPYRLCTGGQPGDRMGKRVTGIEAVEGFEDVGNGNSG